MNFYNEHDPKAAAWLRELIKHEHIPAGIVDERSIEDIKPDELRGYTQCHFFAGIGGWSLALRLAGWPEDRPVWTGSCPCQPFSTAGKGGGFADERHLWPAFHHIISQCKPPVVFGEQVASKDGLAWLDLVRADCEASGYAVGAVDLCAASVGAPHIRQRLWWVANRNDKGLEGRGGVSERAAECVAGTLRVAGRLAHSPSREEHQEQRGPAEVEGGRSADVSGGCGVVERVDDSAGSRRVRTVGDAEADSRDQARMRMSGAGIESIGMADADSQRHAGIDPLLLEEEGGWNSGHLLEVAGCGKAGRPSPLHGFWRDADWLHCRDGKWRPVESGTFPLAHGLPARVVRLRGYGNAIVPAVGAQFIRAYCETVNP